MRRAAAISASLLAPLLVAALLLALAERTPASRAVGEAGPLRVVTTTNFITDMAERLGGDRVRVTGLMGPGVDPHLYKASAGDVRTLREGDLVLYSGLELEGRMADLFEELSATRPTVAVTDGVPRERLLEKRAGRHDPHVWFDVRLWQDAVRTAADALVRADPRLERTVRERERRYLAELRALDAEVEREIAGIPQRRRVLVTSHDAFRYFGARYGIDVEPIQGTSTQTEATTRDVERVAGVVADRAVPTVFIESSVPRQTIDAVLAAAAELGRPARVGGELFGDAAGDRGTPEGTYVGMVRHNVRLITAGLR